MTSVVSELLTTSSNTKQGVNLSQSSSASGDDDNNPLKFKSIFDEYQGTAKPVYAPEKSLDSDFTAHSSALMTDSESGNSLPLDWLKQVEHMVSEGEYSSGAGKEIGAALGLTQQQVAQLETAIQQLAGVQGQDGNEKQLFEAIGTLKQLLSASNISEQNPVDKNLGVALSEFKALTAKDSLKAQESITLGRGTDSINTAGYWNKPEFLGDKVSEQRAGLLPNVKLSDGQANPGDKSGGAGFWLGLSQAEVDAAENKLTNLDLNLKTNQFKKGADYSAQLQTVGSTALAEDGLPMTKSKFDWQHFKLDISQNPLTTGANFLTARHQSSETRNEASTIALEALRPATSVEASPETKATRSSQSIMSNPLVLHSKQWQQDFTQKIQWMTHGKLDKAEIQMDPQELGPLTIRVAQSNGELQVTVQASHSQTRELFELNQERLRELFQEQGLNLSQFDVQSEQRETTEDSSEKQGESDLNGSESMDSEAEVTTVSTLLPNGRLDYFV